MQREVINDCTLYCGDSGYLRAQLKGPFALVADPPYGINWVGVGFRSKFGGVKVIGDDKPFDPRPWLKNAKQAILWGANHYCDKLPGAAGWLIWDKRATSEHSNNQADCEIAWTNLKTPARVFRHQWDGFAKASESGITRVHPTQKSIALMEWCIAKIDPDLTIVDPYMGSGTTAVAAARMGRRFIGAELDPLYFGHAVNRVKAAYAQRDMFLEEEAPPPSCWEQFALFPAET